MGPILIFDKSALQCLSIDESVWLDNYFLTNVTPLFYVETLADLSLPNPTKPPEQIISELSAKTPRGLPNAHHGRLVLGNFMGKPVEVGHGRPIVDRGITKRAPDGKIGVHFDESPEAKAMRRWHKGEFKAIEREFARQWRHTLNTLSFDIAIGIVKNILPTDRKFNSLEQIKSFVDQFVRGNSRELLFLAFDFLGIPDKHRTSIVARWEKEKNPPFNKFAPYVSYVLTVDLLFYIAALRGIIAKERSSNKVDLAYLYYLPFCHVFVSRDKLHARTAPLFMRQNQTFAKAADFKKGLANINEYYFQFQDKIAEVGVIKFAPYPPLAIETSIHKLWDLHCPSWRKSASTLPKKGEQCPQRSDNSTLEHLKKVREESKVIDPKILEDMDDADHVIVSHRVPVQRGSWRILPKGIENQKKDSESDS